MYLILNIIIHGYQCCIAWESDAFFLFSEINLVNELFMGFMHECFLPGSVSG